MMLVEEFKIANAAGRVLMLQKFRKGLTFIDHGLTRLPRDFEGYSVKYTDQIAEPVEDDRHFKVSGLGDVFERV